MHWIYLFIASCLEICWFHSLTALSIDKIKKIQWANFFQNTDAAMALAPLAGYIVFGILNVMFLSAATKGEVITKPMAFAIWSGMVIVGLVVIDATYFKEPTSFWQIVFIAMITGGVIGLRLSTGKI